MTKTKLIQVTLQDWLPDFVKPDFLLPLLDARIIPHHDQYNYGDWPGEERVVYEWVNIVKDGKEYAVGCKATLDGIKFYLYRY